MSSIGKIAMNNFATEHNFNLSTFHEEYNKMEIICEAIAKEWLEFYEESNFVFSDFWVGENVDGSLYILLDFLDGNGNNKEYSLSAEEFYAGPATLRKKWQGELDEQNRKDKEIITNKQKNEEIKEYLRLKKIYGDR